MKIVKTTLCAAAVAFLAGCSVPNDEMIPHNLNNMEKDRITLVSEGNFGMTLLSSSSRIDDHDLLTVDLDVHVENSGFWTYFFKGDPMQIIKAEFTWKDKAGKEIKAAPRYIEQMPGNILSLHSVAPNDSIKTFTLKLTICDAAEFHKKVAEAKKAEAAKAGKKAPEKKAAPKKEVKAPAPVTSVKSTPAKKAAKAAAKAAAKPEAKPAAKPEAKATAKPEAKATAKPEAKAAAKPEAKATAKPEASKTGKLTEPFN